MGIAGTPFAEAQEHGPIGGLPMGQFRASPFRGLSAKGPLKKYLEYTIGTSDVVSVPDGCAFSPSCFTCSLPDCYYTSNAAATKEKRDKELIRLRQEGRPVKELMLRFGLSRNTVSRVLNRKAVDSTKEALHVISG